jgi:hypothetical protein
MSQARTVSFVNRTPVYYDTIAFLQGMLVVEEDTVLISAPQISVNMSLLVSSKSMNSREILDSPGRELKFFKNESGWCLKELLLCEDFRMVLQQSSSSYGLGKSNQRFLKKNTRI